MFPNLPSNASWPSQLTHVPASHEPPLTGIPDPQVGMQNHLAAAALIPSEGIPTVDDGPGLVNMVTSRSDRGHTIRRPKETLSFE